MQSPTTKEIPLVTRVKLMLALVLAATSISWAYGARPAVVALTATIVMIRLIAWSSFALGFREKEDS